MDPQEFRKRFVVRLLTSPWVSVPSALGSMSLAVGYLLGDMFFEFLGLTGVLLGVGMGFTRWMLDADTVARRVYQDLKSETEQTHQDYLNRLERRLLADEDPRTEDILAELRSLYQRMRSPDVAESNLDVELLGDIREKSQTLYRSCLASLERTAAQWELAQQMATKESRRLVLQAREDLLKEIKRSVEHLGATLDHLQLAALKEGPAGDDLSRTREELERGLEVARRVEQRMAEFNQRLVARDDDDKDM
jgi:hypothetical protein